MASENAVVQKLQWYQSITFMTVTFSLDEQYRKKVVAQFEKDCCKLLVEDQLQPVWQIKLRHPIDPSNCQFVQYSKRAELKLRKVGPLSWEDLEAKPSSTVRNVSTKKQGLSSTTANKKLTSSTTTTTKKRKATTGEKQNLTTTTAKQKATTAKKLDSPSSATTAIKKETTTVKKQDLTSDSSAGSVRPTITTAKVDKVKKSDILVTELTPPSPQDVVLINHLSHDMMEKENHSVVEVKINIPSLNAATSSVSLTTHCVDLLFSSSDKQLLSSHQASQSTVFKWKIQLYDSIVPEHSTHLFSSHGVRLTLVKTSTRPWRSLESLSHTATTSPSDQPKEPTASPSPVSTATGSSNSTVKQEVVTEETRASSPQAVSLPSTTTSSQSEESITSPPPLITSSIFSNLQFPFTTVTQSATTPSKTVAASSSRSTTVSSDTSSPSPLSLTIVDSNREDPEMGAPDNTLAGGKINDLDTSFNPFNLLPPSSSAKGEGHKKVLIEELEEKADDSDDDDDDDERYSTPLPDLPEKVQDDQSESTTPSPEPLPPLPKPVFFRLSTQLFTTSLTGIANLGNTCFMSSIVQCLSNTVEVRDMFIGQKYKSELNTTNPLGSKGLLAECFCSVIDRLWSGERQYIYPKKLKRMVSSMSDRFSGYSQQDCHEFCTFLLDALHEDFNRVKDKPLTEQVSIDGRPDVEVARESWLTYKKRNDSFIVDLFGGQFKSTLVCSVCSKVSVTFDPFMSLSVPLPHKMRTMSVIFVPQNPDLEPREVVLNLPPKATLELLKASVGRKVDVSMTELEVFKVVQGKFQWFGNKWYPVSSIQDSDFIVVFEILSRQEAKGSVNTVYVMQRVKYPLKPTRCSGCGRSAPVGKELKRCSKCSAVAYCNRSCQIMDWEGHMYHCHPSRPVLVAMPFVISLPSREFTYSSVMSYAERFARWFVAYTRSSQPVSASHPARPLFDLVPVDGYGSTLPDQPPVCDEGMNVLHLPSRYLAIDWQNNPKEDDHVDITIKDMSQYKKATLDETVLSTVAKSTTLRECLQLFTEPETLPKDNAWYCPQCKEHREATKQMSVWHLPPVLIIHLKRFSCDNTFSYRDKIDLLVKFPISGLDMSPYILGEAANQIDEDDPPIYDLYATANHYGDDHLGHYLAMVRPPRGCEDGYWMYYDDDRVMKILEENLVANSAYVLFYRRRDFETEDNQL